MTIYCHVFPSSLLLYRTIEELNSGLNPSFWWDPQVETQLARSFTMTDEKARLTLFDQMQQETMAQWPAVPLYQPNVNSVFSKRTHGFYLHPVWIFDFLDYWLST